MTLTPLVTTASILVVIGCALQASTAPFPVFVTGFFLIGTGNAFLVSIVPFL